MIPVVSVIIITHNSSLVIDRCLAGIESQTVLPSRVVIIDCGSEDVTYLAKFSEQANYSVHYEENIGYAAANNLGLTLIDKTSDFILLINPDVFLEPECITEGLKIMSQRPIIGVLTGRLKGYNLTENRGSGKLDSTGIFRTWYGRWFDRGQGEAVSGKYGKEEYVPAICGALMFCRAKALEQQLPELFDESFFMYKEDIDLSIRLRKSGWKLLYTPLLQAYHCRGWLRERHSIDRKTRLLSARNDVKLNLKHRSPYILWALAKYILVRFCNF